MTVSRRLAIVGSFGGTHVGGSFARAAARMGVSVSQFETAEAFAGPRVLRAVAWRLCDRRPLNLERFSRKVVAACKMERPDVLLSTGLAPLTKHALNALRAEGIVCVNYLTDDPWNRTQGSARQMLVLQAYDIVFSPRRANLDDLRRLGCCEVRYLPFGYDQDLFGGGQEAETEEAPEVLFVGGADADRVAFVGEFLRAGAPISLVGGYWQRHTALRAHALGQRDPAELSALTAAAKVNLCLVRRANRDGHVMRTFEIAAAGGCMLAEDTEEHRDILGPDGEAVLYFRSPAEAAHKAREMLAEPARRLKMTVALKKRIVSGGHTYTDRLGDILGTAFSGKKLMDIRESA